MIPAVALVQALSRLNPTSLNLRSGADGLELDARGISLEESSLAAGTSREIDALREALELALRDDAFVDVSLVQRGVRLRWRESLENPPDRSAEPAGADPSIRVHVRERSELSVPGDALRLRRPEQRALQDVWIGPRMKVQWNGTDWRPGPAPLVRVRWPENPQVSIDLIHGDFTPRFARCVQGLMVHQEPLWPEHKRRPPVRIWIDDDWLDPEALALALRARPLTRAWQALVDAALTTWKASKDADPSAHGQIARALRALLASWAVPQDGLRLQPQALEPGDDGTVSREDLWWPDQESMQALNEAPLLAVASVETVRRPTPQSLRWVAEQIGAAPAAWGLFDPARREPVPVELSRLLVVRERDPSMAIGESLLRLRPLPPSSHEVLLRFADSGDAGFCLHSYDTRPKTSWGQGFRGSIAIVGRMVDQAPPITVMELRPDGSLRSCEPGPPCTLPEVPYQVAWKVLFATDRFRPPYGALPLARALLALASHMARASVTLEPVRTLAKHPRVGRLEPSRIGGVASRMLVGIALGLAPSVVFEYDEALRREDIAPPWNTLFGDGCLTESGPHHALQSWLHPPQDRAPEALVVAAQVLRSEKVPGAEHALEGGGWAVVCRQGRPLRVLSLSAWGYSGWIVLDEAQLHDSLERWEREIARMLGRSLVAETLRVKAGPLGPESAAQVRDLWLLAVELSLSPPDDRALNDLESIGVFDCMDLQDRRERLSIADLRARGSVVWWWRDLLFDERWAEPGGLRVLEGVRWRTMFDALQRRYGIRVTRAED